MTKRGLRINLNTEEKEWQRTMGRLWITFERRWEGSGLRSVIRSTNGRGPTENEKDLEASEKLALKGCKDL